MNRVQRRQAEQRFAKALTDTRWGALPTWLADQVSAAARELVPIRRGLGQAMGGTERRTSKPPADMLAALALAVATRVTRTCPHVGDRRLLQSPRPVLADLGSRDAACLECIQSGRFPVRRHVDDGLCDICDLPAPGALFTPFVITAGAHLVLGDAGDCCKEALGLGSASA